MFKQTCIYICQSLDHQHNSLVITQVITKNNSALFLTALANIKFHGLILNSLKCLLTKYLLIYCGKTWQTALQSCDKGYDHG